jgi:hypothetical protein
MKLSFILSDKSLVHTAQSKITVLLPRTITELKTTKPEAYQLRLNTA